MLSMLGGNKDALKETFDSVDNLDIADHVPEDSNSEEALVALLDQVVIHSVNYHV